MEVNLTPAPEITFSTPLKLGLQELSHRVVMASMTRNRCLDTYPNELNQLYYTQRASNGGLIFTEHLLVEPQGTEWPCSPGIYDDKAVKEWSKIVAAVHNKNCKIFAQLWHGGRICHPLHQNGRLPRGPSAIAAQGGRFRLLNAEATSYVTPVAIEDPQHYVDLFAKAAENAMKAGFDGVELHGAGGYLPNQFLDTSANQRTDEWGGSVANRCRFVLAVIDAMIKSCKDPKKVGIKLAPNGGYNDVGMPLSDTLETFSYLLKELSVRGIGHVQMERKDTSKFPRGTAFDVRVLRQHFSGGVWIMNGGYNAETGLAALKDGSADAISFASFFITNPDLPSRILHGLPLRDPNYEKLYGHWSEPEKWSEGYVDW